METEKTKNGVAQAEEVLMYLTGVLRGESLDDAKVMSSRMKAAELLGRRVGAFEGDGTEAGQVMIVDDVSKKRKKAESV